MTTPCQISNSIEFPSPAVDWDLAVLPTGPSSPSVSSKVAFVSNLFLKTSWSPGSHQARILFQMKSLVHLPPLLLDCFPIAFLPEPIPAKILLEQ